jgi:hypothetical protein
MVQEQARELYSQRALNKRLFFIDTLRGRQSVLHT